MLFNLQRIGGLLMVRSLVFVFVLAFGAGCNLLPREAKVPLATRRVSSLGTSAAHTLIVFLPGRKGSMIDFERHGFIKELQNASIKADVIAVDAHLGYYYKRTIIDRMREDVLAPARAHGYQRILVVGISLGGLGALLCDRDLHGSVDGFVLLSPFLGDRARLFKEIETGGGPLVWAKGRDLHSGDVGEEIWTFLGQRSSELPPLWLYFARTDSLATGQRLLASLLPPARVGIVEGGHDWKTWEKIWHDVCASGEVFREEKAVGPGPSAKRRERGSGREENLGSLATLNIEP